MQSNAESLWVILLGSSDGTRLPQVRSARSVSSDIETRGDADADLAELRCLELQHKTELDNALYEYAYHSMRRRSAAR